MIISKKLDPILSFFPIVSFDQFFKAKSVETEGEKEEAYLSTSCHCLRGRVCSPDSRVVRSWVSIFPRCWTALSCADWHEWPVVEYAYIRSNKIYCSVNCTRERMGKQNEAKRYTCRRTKCTESRIGTITRRKRTTKTWISRFNLWPPRSCFSIGNLESVLMEGEINGELYGKENWAGSYSDFDQVSIAGGHFVFREIMEIV